MTAFCMHPNSCWFHLKLWLPSQPVPGLVHQGICISKTDMASRAEQPPNWCTWLRDGCVQGLSDSWAPCVICPCRAPHTQLLPVKSNEVMPSTAKNKLGLQIGAKQRSCLCGEKVVAWRGKATGWLLFNFFYFKNRKTKGNESWPLQNPYCWDPLWWHPIIPLQITNKMCGCQSRPCPGSVDGSTQAHPLLSLSRQTAAYVLTLVLLHSFLIPRSKPGAKRASDTRTVWIQLPWKSFFKCTDERRETSDLQWLWKMSWRPSS